MMTKTFIHVLRVTVFLAGLLFIILGLFRNEHREIMNMAVKICLECIGIG